MAVSNGAGSVLPTGSTGTKTTTTSNNPFNTTTENDLQVNGVGSLLGLNWGAVSVETATTALSTLATKAETSTSARAALAQIQNELYLAGYYGTKKPTLGSLSGGDADEAAFHKALIDASNAGQPIGDFLQSASQNAVATGVAGGATVAPTIAETQQVFTPGDIQGTVDSTAETLLGRKATAAEVQQVVNLLNSQSAGVTNADIANKEVTAANSAESTSSTKDSADVDAFLAATRQHESGGNYTATNPNGGASGAYQYIQSTWTSEAKAAGYAQYANAPASSAPASVQDAVARYNALNLYASTGSWAQVAANWYDPAYANDPNYAPPGNNGLTIGQYSSDIVNLMNQASGAASAPGAVPAVVGAAQSVVGKAAVDPQSHPNGQPLAQAALPGAIAKAEGEIGTPYQWGGDSPTAGFDCSGLVQWAYQQTGVSLPRVAQDQYNATTKVSASAAKPGDLVFFGTGPNGVDHVGIYIGNDQMVVAPHTGTKVQIQSGVLEMKDLVGVTQVTSTGLTPADWAALSQAQKQPGGAAFLAANNANAPASSLPADNVTITPTPAGADSVTDAATNVLENQDSNAYQQNNLLSAFDTINKTLAATGGVTSANANARKTPISMNPETS